MVNIIFVDIHQDLADEMEKVRWKNVTDVRRWTNVKDIDIAPGMAFVSPSNSLGFMDGGIDFVLSRVMFPGIEAKVKQAYKENGHMTLLGRPYLPIGHAITVETHIQNVYLISAPTMWLPQDVSKTHNAYHAMYSILREASRKKEITQIVLCGLCTGVGRMSSHIAIQQMKEAFDDFESGKEPKYNMDDIVKEQPSTYMNTEFKEIDSDKVYHV